MKAKLVPVIALATGVFALQFPSVLRAQAGDAQKGKVVFEQCAVCHNVESDEKKVGPSLKGLFSKATLTNGKPANHDNVLAFIDAGGNGMPGYADILEAQEKTDLMAYLREATGGAAGGAGVPAAGAHAGMGDIAAGKTAAEQCTACHNFETDEKKVGPGLKNLFKREKLANDKPVNHDTVLEFINKGGNGMPGYEEMLEPKEKADLLAYMKHVSGVMPDAAAGAAGAAQTGTAAEAHAAAGVDPAMVAKGKEVFEQCGACHNADSIEKKVGPGLKGLFHKETLGSGKASNEENIRVIILEGGEGMPGYKNILEAGDIDALIIYLKSL